jgi:hypothetical protein
MPKGGDGTFDYPRCRLDELSIAVVNENFEGKPDILTEEIVPEYHVVQAVAVEVTLTVAVNKVWVR